MFPVDKAVAPMINIMLSEVSGNDFTRDASFPTVAFHC